MGLIQFAKSAGRKLGLFKGDDPEESALAEQQKRDRIEQRNRMVGSALAQSVRDHGLEIADLAVSFAAGRAILSGVATSQADREKAVLIVGNTENVEQVDDRLRVERPEPPAIYHTVVEGDTLSEISGKNYGVIRLYDVIFAANQPMLSDPDEIYPGQVLRIPRVTALPTHVVKRGETLGTIAKHWYGDPKKYSAIFMANRDVIEDMNVIEPGWELVIPVKGPAVDLGEPEAQA